MKIAVIVLVLCAVSICNVSDAAKAKKGKACFIKGKLIGAMMAMKGKGNPTPADVKKCMGEQLQDKSKQPEVEKCIDDCTAQHKDPMKLAVCAITAIKKPCPDIEFLEKMLGGVKKS